MVGARWNLAVYSQTAQTPHTENVLELQHFEDLPLGAEWTTRRRTVTEADVAAFVGLSGDYNPLYSDVEHARSSIFGGTVAPGGLVAALTAGLGSMDVPLPATVGLVGMSWKFLLPVQPGDTLSSRWRLSRKRNVENPKWGLAVWQVEVENQRGELVASGEMTRLVAKREQVAERTGRSRRRRRKGAPAGQAAAEVVLSEPVPEPAPADLPPPAARRRRRRGAPEPAPETPALPSQEMVETGPPQGPPQGPATEAAAEPATEPSPSPSKRRRRRRSGNGNANGREGGGDSEALAAAQPAPAPVREQPAEPEPGGGGEQAPEHREAPDRASSEAPGESSGAQQELLSPFRAPEEAEGGGAPPEHGLGRVFRRLRRP
jgi:acyl dehydratase